MEPSQSESPDQTITPLVSSAMPTPSTREEWEQVRRSVAMMPPGSWAMRREEALSALGALVEQL